MDSETPSELAELLMRRCTKCGRRSLVVHEIEALPPLVTLRCDACGYLEHTVLYKPSE